MLATPILYSPYGGVCAYQMRKGELKDSNPAAFLIYKGKLYAVLPR